MVRVVRGGLHGLGAPAFLAAGVLGSRGGTRLGAIARGTLLVVPIVVVVGALLSSADAIFASFVDIDGGDFIAHALFIGIGLVTFGGLVRMVSSPATALERDQGPKLGMVEASMVLLALNVVLGAFAVGRLVALSEGGRRVLDDAGLTYAEYARSGFFPLLAVAAIVIVTVLALRATADVTTTAQRRAFTALALGVVVLTLAVCVSAFQRLVLYENAFGMTMLRLFVQTAIVWMSVVLVMLGIAVVLRRRRAWVVPASVLASLVLLVALNVFNPEAFVARYNLTHEPTSEGVDASYLSLLSEDAVDVLAPAARGDGAEAERLRSEICADVATEETGWASFNFATNHARDVRAELCR